MLLDKLDQSIAKQLQRAQTTVAALHSTLEGFHNTFVLLNSLPGFSKSEPSKDGKRLAETPELSQSLLEAADLLDQLSRFLNEVLTDREVTRKSLSQVLTLVEQIQGRLADADNRVGAFQQRLRVTGERISSSQATIPVWIEKGSLFVIVLLACFAFTQIGLILQARQLLGKSNSERG
jgi:2,3-bisphosphoglycerate-independent phosphoglycerate mutase